MNMGNTQTTTNQPGGNILIVRGSEIHLWSIDEIHAVEPLAGETFTVIAERVDRHSKQYRDTLIVAGCTITEVRRILSHFWTRPEIVNIYVRSDRTDLTIREASALSRRFYNQWHSIPGFGDKGYNSLWDTEIPDDMLAQVQQEIDQEVFLQEEADWYAAQEERERRMRENGD